MQIQRIWRHEKLYEEFAPAYLNSTIKTAINYDRYGIMIDIYTEEIIGLVKDLVG